MEEEPYLLELVRCVGGWQAALSLRRGREAWAAVERILGSSEFVEKIQQAVSAQGPSLPRSRAAGGAP